jgi:hypothetical protein
MSALDSLVKQIIIQSEFGPDIVIDQPFSGSPSASGGSVIMGVLKPQITIVTSLGNQAVAPWGAPGPTKWPFVEIGLMLALVAGFGFLVKMKHG